MPKQNIHQLEERVLVLIGEFRRLKDENQELSRQVDQLNREKETLLEEQNLNQVAKDRLSKLEFLDKKKRKGSQSNADKDQDSFGKSREI